MRNRNKRLGYRATSSALVHEGNGRDAGAVEDICSHLTEQPPRSFFLCAGAGSGKTRTLVEVLCRQRMAGRPILKDFESLTAAAEAGKISWRETLLCGCTKRGPCEYGGVDNVGRWGDGDGLAACVDALFECSREAEFKQLRRVIEQRIGEAAEGTLYLESLKAQHRAAENALDVTLTS